MSFNEQFGVAVAPSTYIREVLGWNLGHFTNILTDVRLVFPQSLQVNVGCVLILKPRTVTP
jgi:hypothetical protein